MFASIVGGKSCFVYLASVEALFEFVVNARLQFTK
jgi:hypothetical protein